MKNRPSVFLLTIFVSFFLASTAFAGNLPSVTQFDSGDTARASDVNAVHNAIRAEVDDNATAINDLESVTTPNIFMEYFINGTTETTAECANWAAFRASLQPEKYTCVQLVGSLGKGLTTCDAESVVSIATALRDGTTTDVVVDTDTWRVGECIDGIEVSVNSTNMCECDGHAIRPCIGSSNWGGVGPASDTCGPASQSIQLIFR